MKLSEIVNQANKWIFCDFRVDRFLILNPELNITKRKFVINFELIKIILLSIIIIFIFYLQQYLYIFNKSKIFYKYIILKVNEGHEEKNIFRMLNIHENDVLRINAFKKSDFMKVQKISLIKLLKKYITNVKELYKIFNYNFPNNLRILVFKNCSLNLAHFSYLCAFFNECKKNNENIITLTAGAFFQSNAAISEGISSHQFFHGGIGEISSVVLPFYDCIYVYSIEEKQYLLDLKTKSEIFVYPYEKILSHTDTVIFFMRKHDNTMNKDSITTLLKVFQKYNYEIYFKNHPTYGINKMKNSGKLTYNLAKQFKIKIIEGKLEDAYSIIKEKKPRFIVSWYSTAICESLNCGVIPITLADPSVTITVEDQLKIKNKDIDLNISLLLSSKQVPLKPDFRSAPHTIVYPIFKRSISWASESNILHDLLDSKVEYKKMLKKLHLR